MIDWCHCSGAKHFNHYWIFLFMLITIFIKIFINTHLYHHHHHWYLLKMFFCKYLWSFHKILAFQPSRELSPCCGSGAKNQTLHNVRLWWLRHSQIMIMNVNLMQNVWKLFLQDCSNRLWPYVEKLWFDPRFVGFWQGPWNLFLLNYFLSVWHLSVTKTLIKTPASCRNIIDALAAAGSILEEQLLT